MGMPVTAIYIVVVTLIGPALIKVGIEPLAAHLFICYFGVLSFITPPVCTATYVAAGIAGSEPLRTAFLGLRLGIAAYVVPFIFCFAPALILMGTGQEIIFTVVFAVIGIVMIAMALGGYCTHHLNFFERIWTAGAGICLIMPDFEWAVLGLSLTIVFFLYEYFRQRAASKQECLEPQG
jgi:TRAP-type uncharacterized transport system fused permease subunit